MSFCIRSNMPRCAKCGTAVGLVESDRLYSHKRGEQHCVFFTASCHGEKDVAFLWTFEWLEMATVRLSDAFGGGGSFTAELVTKDLDGRIDAGDEVAS